MSQTDRNPGLEAGEVHSSVLFPPLWAPAQPPVVFASFKIERVHQTHQQGTSGLYTFCTFSILLCTVFVLYVIFKAEASFYCICERSVRDGKQFLGIIFVCVQVVKCDFAKCVCGFIKDHL